MLRPNKLDDIIGQDKAKRICKILVNSAIKRKEHIPHILLDGPPGIGKSTFARAIANEMGESFQEANGTNFSSLKSILPYIGRITQNSILFIDETHRIRKNVEEWLYPIMEDFFMTLTQGEETIKAEIPSFTMIGATTQSGLLTKPFYDRFVHKIQLTYYSDEDLKKIAYANIAKLGLSVKDEVIQSLVNVSRGTPRIVNNFLLWIRDYSLSEQVNEVTPSEFNKALQIKGVTLDGLTKNDRIYLDFLSQNGIVGLRTIAAATGLATETITENIEPYLLRKNMIVKTSKGRRLV